MEQQPKIDHNLSRAEIYPLLLEQAKALLEGETDPIANMANIAALIKESLGFHWVGFYRLIGDELVLGPFQGPVACTRIKVPNGVCGTCVAQKKTIIVPNVEEFPGHIACSALSKSEIVVPFFENQQVTHILDIDSDKLNDFSELDRSNLDRLTNIWSQ